MPKSIISNLKKQLSFPHPFSDERSDGPTEVSKGVYDAPAMLDAEEAETTVFTNVMQRVRASAPTVDSLKALPSVLQQQHGGTTEQKAPLLPPKQRFAAAVMQIQAMKRMSSIEKRNSGSRPSAERGRHRYQGSSAQDVLESIRKVTPTTEKDTAVFSTTDHSDLLLSRVDSGREDEHGDEDESEQGGEGSERLPLRGGDSPRYGSMAERISRVRRNRKHKLCARLKQRILNTCHPRNVCRFALDMITHSFAVVLGIPLSALAWIFFYCLGNPGLDFIAGTATLAWWLNFLSRQMVALDCARIAQWILLDCFVLSSRVVSRLVGPAISLFCIEAKGWPVIFTMWSLFDLVFLHGDNKYCTHWLYWTGLKIYSLDNANSGTYILSSSIYLRVLIAMLLAGLASSIKRFSLTFRFSQRQCLDFKPRLEKILVEMILLSEVANLAEQAKLIQSIEQLDEPGKVDLKTPTKLTGIQTVAFDMAKGSAVFDEDDQDDQRRDSTISSPGVKMRNGELLSINSSGKLRIKNLLDNWEPPVNKNYKTEVSIKDVLVFQAALAYMSNDNPFGAAFGPASDRDQCIQSSLCVYTNLLTLNTSEKPVLDFEVLLLAASNDEGVVDSGRKNMLRRLFRPDAENQITELAFIQSCDAIYKRLCYFRASVGNASVIDNVLAGIVDGFFYFILTLVLLSLLEFNPWTLLVSLTSLLVSVSFALGPSVSKYVEGVLLIAVRRPFDLGDRIYIGSADTTVPSGVTADMSSNTWFVEDINLSTTTLRYARTNEVSTLNNWAIAGSKIINCNRSPSAIVVLDTKLHISILRDDALQLFQADLQKYVKTHPRTWESLVFCRHDVIDADNEQVAFTYVHWQVLCSAFKS